MVDVEFEEGKIYAVVGPSGCGKTTLLSLLGGLDFPIEGQILKKEIKQRHSETNRSYEPNGLNRYL